MRSVRLMALAAALLAPLALTACNTVAGAGKDVNSAGNAITDGSQAVSKKLPTP